MQLLRVRGGLYSEERNLIEFLNNEFVRVRLQYKLEPESGEHYPFVHVDVHKWSKELYLSLIDSLYDLLEEHDIDELFAEIPAENLMNQKFAIKFGFSPIGETSEGILYEFKKVEEEV